MTEIEIFVPWTKSPLDAYRGRGPKGWGWDGCKKLMRRVRINVNNNTRPEKQMESTPPPAKSPEVPSKETPAAATAPKQRKPRKRKDTTKPCVQVSSEGITVRFD